MNQGFFQYNNSIINQILDFATSSYDLFFLSGQKGTTKSETIEKIITELEADNLIFRHFCFENSVIDDFLLTFYDKLKDFSIANQISLKKFATADFKEKVSHYFKEIPKNCIIVVENFEKIDTNKDIIALLCHLANYPNVKLIVSTLNKNENLFDFGGIRAKSAVLEPLDKDDFKSKLAILTQTLDSELKEKFFEITGGNELYLNMTIKYCINTGCLLSDLVAEYERKKEDFERFLISKFITLMPSDYLEFYKNLCLLAVPAGVDFIAEYGLGNPDYIEYLTKNYLVNKFRNEAYVKDYFKKYALEMFSIQEKITCYTRLIRAFENEITKSPKDRLLRLSRESMRSEVARFRALRPKIQAQSSSNPLLFNLGINSEIKPLSPLAQKLQKIKEKKNKLASKTPSALNPSAANPSKVQNDLNIGNSADMENKKKIIEHINSARTHSGEYRFREALEELTGALKLDFRKEFRIELCMLSAKCYFALNDYDNVYRYYHDAYTTALETKDLRKCEIEFSIAQLNKSLYKTDSAKEQFSLIVLNADNPVKYRALSSLELGDIEAAASNDEIAIKHFKDALEFALGVSKKLVCTAYYKLALLYDEKGDIENASFYYKKNYLTSSSKTENPYYSISLSNLALILSEQRQYPQATECLKMALAYDSEDDDFENMYYCQKELAKLYSKFDERSSEIYYKQAILSAKKLKNNFMIALIYFEKGENCYDKGDDGEALLNFLSSRNLLSPSDAENLARINQRIEDIKMRLDKETYNLITETYGKF